MTREARLAAAGFLWLGLFALIATAGAGLELWPAPPEDAFRNTDLWAGLGFGVILLGILVTRADHPREDPGLEASRREAVR